MEVHFVILLKNGKAKKFRLLDGEFITIGRSDKCQIQLDDDLCSSRHCRIKCFDSYIQIEDLDSKNGVFVNQVKILNQKIYIDDKVTLGGTSLFINIKRMSKKDIRILTYRGSAGRGVGNLTLELDKNALLNSKALNLKNKKQKLKTRTNLPNNFESKSINKVPRSQQAELVEVKVTFLTKLMIIGIDSFILFIMFYLLNFVVKETYPHLAKLGADMPIHEYIFKAEVIPFTVVCLFTTVVLYKLLTVILKGSFGELILGIKK